MFFSFLFFLLQCLFFVFSPLHFFQLKLFSVSLFLPHPNAFSHHFSFHFLSPLTMIHSITTFLPHYSLPSASFPSPSSSSLSSSLPLSAAFSFPFHVDLPPPTLPSIKPPTRPKHPKALVNASTMSASHLCPASCFSAILSQHSHSLRSTHHNSFDSQATSRLLCFPLTPDATPSPVESALPPVSPGHSHCCLRP